MAAAIQVARRAATGPKPWGIGTHLPANARSTRLSSATSLQQSVYISTWSVHSQSGAWRIDASSVASTPCSRQPATYLPSLTAAKHSAKKPRTTSIPLNHILRRHASNQPLSPTSKPSSSPETPSPPISPLKNPIKSLKSLTPHENIYTLPNILTFTRLIAAPCVGYFILTAQPLAALCLFAYAGITDLVDGWLARRFNSGTVVGSVIDPMADKLLMAVCTLSLGWVGIFPWWLVVVIFGRDFGLAISAIWWRWISLPPPKTMGRYWDFSLPSAEVHPTEISKINTLLQLLLVGNAMVLPVLPEVWITVYNLWGIQQGWEGLVATTTVLSGLSYIGNKDAVKILSQEEVQQAIDKREAERDVEGQAKTRREDEMKWKGANEKTMP